MWLLAEAFIEADRHRRGEDAPMEVEWHFNCAVRESPAADNHAQRNRERKVRDETIAVPYRLTSEILEQSVDQVPYHKP